MSFDRSTTGIIHTFAENKTSELITLGDFLEKPKHNLTGAEIQCGVEKVLNILGENPDHLLTFIYEFTCKPENMYLLANNVFADLADKMEALDKHKNLAVIFDNYSDQLVKDFIWNQFDLERITKICSKMTDKLSVKDELDKYTDKVLQSVCNNRDVFKRILEAEKNPLATLNDISKQYKPYEQKFKNAYDTLYAVASSPPQASVTMKKL